MEATGEERKCHLLFANVRFTETLPTVRNSDPIKEAPSLISMLATVAAAVRVGKLVTPDGMVTAVIAPGTSGFQLPAFVQSLSIFPVHVAAAGGVGLKVCIRLGMDNSTPVGLL